MTEEHGILFNELTNEFWVEYGKLIASILNKAPKELHDELLMSLSDHSSVYGSNFDEYLK